MKILIAPDSFKGSLSSLEVAESIERGILKVIPGSVIYKVPMADGGEGTVASLVYAAGGRIINKEVIGPLGKPIESFFGVLENQNTAVIEMASASGYTLVPPGEYNPLKTTTYGTGQLIKAALDEGVDRIIIGLGGSSTNDAGVGMAQALGVKFLDDKGEEVKFGGEELIKIRKIDLSGLDSRVKNVEIIAASDVLNPLYGGDGAAYIYGPQKGATPEIVEYLDNCLRHFAGIVQSEFNIDAQKIVGGGAAGGLGAGLVIFLNAKIKPGIQIVMETNNIDYYLKKANLVFTGEGRIDAQTLMGKTIMGITKRAKKYNLPVIAITGEINEKVMNLDSGIDCIFSINLKPSTLDEAIKNTSKWIQITTEQIMKNFLLKK